MTTTAYYDNQRIENGTVNMVNKYLFVETYTQKNKQIKIKQLRFYQMDSVL